MTQPAHDDKPTHIVLTVGDGTAEFFYNGEQLYKLPTDTPATVGGWVSEDNPHNDISEDMSVEQILVWWQGDRSVKEHHAAYKQAIAAINALRRADMEAVIGENEADDRWDGQWRNGYNSRGNLGRKVMEQRLKG